MKLPRLLRARSGSAFDSRVGRDHEDAKAQRKRDAVETHLKRLVLSDSKVLTERAQAAKLLAQLWAKVSRSANDRNDLAVAFAWLQRWDEAQGEIKAAVEAARNGDANGRAVANRDVIAEARKEAR